VTTSIVVRSIFLALDELLRVVQLAVSSRADLIDNSRLKVDEHTARDVLASTSL
jgi:hypothetical protein